MSPPLLNPRPRRLLDAIVPLDGSIIYTPNASVLEVATFISGVLSGPPGSQVVLLVNSTPFASVFVPTSGTQSPFGEQCWIPLEGGTDTLTVSVFTGGTATAVVGGLAYYTGQ